MRITRQESKPLTNGALTILIIDDEVHVREILGEACARRGITVCRAASGEEALAREDLAAIDVALIDVHLGTKLDGHAVAQEFARNHPHIAIILMSGLATLDDAVAALSENAFAFVTKPFQSLTEVVLLAERAAEAKRLESQNRDYAQRLVEYNQELEQRVAVAAGNLQRYERMLAHLFAVSYRLGELDSVDAVLDSVCAAITEAGIFRRAVILLADSRYMICQVGLHSVLPDEHSLRKTVAALVGTPLRPFDFTRDESPVGAGFVAHPRHTLGAEGKISNDLSGRPTLIVPITRHDGTVTGFLSASDSAAFEEPQAPVAQMLEVLLKHAALHVEALGLRNQLRGKNDELEQRVIDRTAELRNSQDNFSRLVNATTDIVYLTDASLRVVYLNEAFSQVLGYPRENFIGRSLSHVLDELAVQNPENRESWSRLFDLTNDRELVTLELYSGSNAVRTFEINRSVIRQGGELKGTQGIARDVSERRLLIDQLVAAERLAVTGRIAAGIAHEINNPLQAVVSQVSAIRAKIESEESPRENLQLVQDALERIRQIVRGMLDLSRPSARTESDVQLNNLLQAVVALLSPQAKHRHVSLVLHLDPELPSIRASGSELQQAVMNLVLNAFDAMPDGGTVTMKTVSSEGTIQISVEDTGIGIAAGDISLIFEPFFSKRAVGHGSGLGLFITKTIVELHRGKIDVASESGKGTTVTMVFPVS